MWIALNNNLKAAGEKLINNHQDAIEPQMPLIFNALKKVKVEDIKVVILGQDPTPQEGKAKGVAFLVDNPRTVPAVLNMLLGGQWCFVACPAGFSSFCDSLFSPKIGGGVSPGPLP